MLQSTSCIVGVGTLLKNVWDIRFQVFIEMYVCTMYAISRSLKIDKDYYDLKMHWIIESLENILGLIRVFLAVMHWKLFSVLFREKWISRGKLREFRQKICQMEK